MSAAPPSATVVATTVPAVSTVSTASATAPASAATATTTIAVVGEVVVEQITGFRSSNLGNTRSLNIFLPPGYAAQSDAHYKVLYLNDGQDAPLLRLKDTLETLYEQLMIEPIIVVAISATGARMIEYGTAGTPNTQGMGSRAGEYTKFVTQELLPFIDSRYRTLTGPQNTAIAGSSLGGLSAFDIAWNNPGLFGKVGVFSGSFWWRTDDSSSSAKQSSRIMHRIVRESGKRPSLKMWFEAGTRDEVSDRDGNGVIDAVQDTTELIDELKRKGYQPDVDITYVEVAGGQHNQATWAKVLPDFLAWAFPLAQGVR